jgi:hypothetical protein
MLQMFRILLITASLAISSGDAFCMDHQDDWLDYWTCSGAVTFDRWSARWDTAGNPNGFIHRRASTGIIHPDTIINFVTWDGSCWQAYWDVQQQSFHVKQFPSGRDERYDTVLRYIAWDNSLWSAQRQGTAWYHLGPSP